MHEYYEKNRGRLKKTMKGFLALVGPELERISGKNRNISFDEIWDIYERDKLLSHYCKILQEVAFSGNDGRADSAVEFLPSAAIYDIHVFAPDRFSVPIVPHRREHLQ